MSRRFFHENLEDACTNVAGLVHALEQVAANYRTAEQANTIDPSQIEDPVNKIDVSLSDWDHAVGALVIGGMWTLTIRNLAVGATVTGAGKISVAALLANTLWALFTPLDTELTELHNKWYTASDHLQQFSQRIPAVKTQFAKTWSDSEGAELFQKYLDKLNAEVAEGQLLLDKTAAALLDVHRHLDKYQAFWFAYSLAVLVLLVGLQMSAAAVPPASGPIKALIELTGGMLSKAVGSWVGMVGEVARAALITAGVVPLGAKSFVSQKQAWSHGSRKYDGLDLESVALSPDELDTIRTKH